MRRTVLTVLALVLSLTPLLAGCGKSGDGSGTAQKEPAGASKMKAAQAKAYGGSKGEAPKTGGQ